MRPDESKDDDSAGASGSVLVALHGTRASGLVPARLGSVDFLEAEDVLDILHDEQLIVSDELDSLTRALAERGAPLTARQALAVVRDALAVFLLAAGARPVPRAFLPEAALARYLLALYSAIHVAIHELLHGASSVHDAPLPAVEPVRRELVALAENAADPGAVEELTAAFERLANIVEGASHLLA